MQQNTSKYKPTIFIFIFKVGYTISKSAVDDI